MAFLCESKPEIIYPTIWEYKIIISSMQKVDEILNKEQIKPQKITKSHDSKNGKYTSYDLSFLVQNEEQRLYLFEKLKQNEKVKYLL